MDKAVNDYLKTLNYKSRLLLTDLEEGGRIGNDEIPEWLIRSYYPHEKGEQFSSMDRVVTIAQYFPVNKYDGNKFKTMYAFRFMPFSGDEKSEKLGNSHKCAYRYDFSHVPSGVWYDHIGNPEYPNEQTAYLTIRARYIGDSPIYEGILKDEKWWNRPDPTEVVRHFAMVARPRVTDKKPSGDMGHKFGWAQRTQTGINNWVDLEWTYYLSMTMYYNDDGSIDTFNAECRQIAPYQFERKSCQGWLGNPIRPVRDYTRM